MKKITFLVLLTAVCSFSQAQSADHEAVMKPVKTLFEAMQKGDSALLHSAFSNTVTLASIGTDKAGKPVIRFEPLQDFLASIGSPHAEVYNEMIWDEKISIDGNFAQVWTPYAFYLGKKYSHCGVDAFHLIKSADGNWKIFHLADTRHKNDCSVPAKISKQFE
jgi:hypothetical protein